MKNFCIYEIVAYFCRVELKNTKAMKAKWHTRILLWFGILYFAWQISRIWIDYPLNF